MARHTIPGLANGVDHRPALAGSTALNLFLSLRPFQWTKNLIVFAGVIFGAKLLDPTAVWRSLAAFAIFCALSGVVYLINDVADREADKRHPLKQHRPIASGALPVRTAIAAAALLGGLGLIAAFGLGL